MVRECRPLERELSSLKLGRRSTMRTSVPASVSSAASIIPVGPPPAITTACSDIHHSSFPNICQETLHHTRGLAASPGGGTILRWRERGPFFQVEVVLAVDHQSLERAEQAHRALRQVRQAHQRVGGRETRFLAAALLEGD